MRVAQLIETLDAGGAEGLAVDFAAAFAARGHESHLLVVDGSGPFARRVSPGVRFTDLADPRPRGSRLAGLHHTIGLQRVLGAYAARHGLEVLQTHLPKANQLGLLVSGKRGLRVYPTVHNTREFDYGVRAGRLVEWGRRRAYRLMLSHCARMIAVSPAARDGMIAELGLAGRPAAERIVTIENGVRIPPPPAPEARVALRAEFGVPHDGVLFTGIGRLTAQKDFGMLLQALARLPEEGAPWRCVVAGEGEARGDLRSALSELGLTDRVALPGHVADVAGLLAATDVFCLSSRYEGLPLVLLEALAAGVAVAATAIGGVSEVVADGRSALLAPAGDPVAFAGILDRYRGDPGLRAAVGAAGRELVRADYDFERTVDRLEELFRDHA